MMREAETHVSLDVGGEGVFCLQRSWAMSYHLPVLLNIRGRPRLMVVLEEFSLRSHQFTQQKRGFGVIWGIT